jgi:hypothetical protein
MNQGHQKYKKFITQKKTNRTLNQYIRRDEGNIGEYLNRTLESYQASTILEVDGSGQLNQTINEPKTRNAKHPTLVYKSNLNISNINTQDDSVQTWEMRPN